MKLTPFILLTFFTVTTHAGEQRIYQQDSMGNIQYHKPSYTVQKNGRIIETDTIGNKQYHKQQYQMKDATVYPVDSVGNIQYNKPRVLIK
jgi:hypothetical protein